MKKGKKKEGLKITRRQFLKSTLATGALVAASGAGVLIKPEVVHAVANSPNLSKWHALQKLRLFGVDIPAVSSAADLAFPNTDFYQVTAGEFTDVLHPDMGGPGVGAPTTLWGYWDTTTGIRKHLGGVIVATRGKAARIRFTNTLPTQHIIPVDRNTIPGAIDGDNRIAVHLHGGFIPWITDGGPFDWWKPDSSATGGKGLSFRNGPMSVLDNRLGDPMLVSEADYFYPNDQSTRLMWYHDHAHGITRVNAYAGLATGYLVLDAVNDHYAGAPAKKIPAVPIPVVFQDKVFVWGDPVALTGTYATDPTWKLVVPAKAQTPGSLWYEHIYDPNVFRVLKAKKYTPPPNASAIPEFFGDTMLANGTVYPYLEVEPKRYRFVLLNACNARFLNINLLQVTAGTADITTNPKTGFANLAVNPAGPPIIQIGNEAGFLYTEAAYPNGIPFNPATLTGNLLLAPAERADIIIDFTNMDSKEFIMYNDAPGPFPVGPPTNDYYLGNPKNPIQPLASGTGPDTRHLLRIKVNQPLTGGAADPQLYGPVNDVFGLPVTYQGTRAGSILDTTLIDPTLLTTPATTTPPIPVLAAPAGALGPRDLTLNEDFDQWGRLRQLLGTTAPALVGKGFGLEYLVPATEKPIAGTTEVWRIFNLTADTHPIHFHLVNVQILSRQPFKVVNGVFTPTGLARGPEPNELGWKETVQMHPGEVTSVAMKFDLPAVPFQVPFSDRPMGGTVAAPAVIPDANEYVWHCHILEHEEHDMMRPMVVIGSPLSVTTLQEIKGSTGGTATYFISGGTAPYNIASSDPTNYPASVTPTGFTVSVGLVAIPPGVTTPVATFTVTDSAATPASVVADLYVV